MTRLKSAYSRPNFVRHIGRKITEKNNFSKTVEPKNSLSLLEILIFAVFITAVFQKNPETVQFYC